MKLVSRNVLIILCCNHKSKNRGRWSSAVTMVMGLCKLQNFKSKLICVLNTQLYWTTTLPACTHSDLQQSLLNTACDSLLKTFYLQWSHVITNTVNTKFLIKQTLLGGPVKAPIVYCIFPYRLTQMGLLRNSALHERKVELLKAHTWWNSV